MEDPNTTQDSKPPPENTRHAAPPLDNPLEKLFHPETFGVAKIKRPCAAALWNSAVGIVVVVVIALGIALSRGLLGLMPFISYKNLAYVAAGLVATVTVHSFLGAKIGARKAANILSLLFGLAAIAYAYHITRG